MNVAMTFMAFLLTRVEGVNETLLWYQNPRFQRYGGDKSNTTCETTSHKSIVPSAVIAPI